MKRKIVLVEDEHDLCFLIKGFLEQNGYEVHAAHDGFEGQQLILRENPDLVVLDFIMPRIKGYEVRQFIKSHPELSHTPVILMSGLDGITYLEENTHLGPSLKKVLAEVTDLNTDPAKRTWRFAELIAKELDVFAFLAKPFHRNDLLNTVRQVFAGA